MFNRENSQARSGSSDSANAFAPRTILIMAGGTGGHVFPALAVADYLRAKGWRVVWLATRQGMEARLVPQYGYDIAWINFSGLRGKGLLRWLALPFNLILACVQAASALFRHRPHVVLGMGGFAGFPGGLAAWILRRPVVIHEQNSIAGLTNKALACVAKKVLVAFPDAFTTSKMPRGKQRLCNPRTVLWAGNPVRKEIAAVAPPEARFEERANGLQLLVIGGSLGAQALNETVPKALALLTDDQRPIVIHQAGTKHFDRVKLTYQESGVEATVLAFIEDMAAQYSRCDLLICRAGALTVAEIAAAGVASILIPFPGAVDDHQTYNARFLTDRGAGILLPQNELNPAKLAELLKQLTRNKLLDIAKAARALSKPDATQFVAEQCMELANEA